MPIETWIKRGRRRLMFEEGPTTEIVELGRSQIECMLPHRDPFLLLDMIDRVDLKEGMARGSRYIDPNDPVFVGHFPEYPVYPGTLQMEMIGQIGLCLHHLLDAGRSQITSEDTPRNLRLMKLHHALFLAEVRPGMTVQLMSRILHQDSYTVTCAGQVVQGDTICSLGIMDAYLFEKED